MSCRERAAAGWPLVAGCHDGAGTNASPTVSISQAPEGFVIAGATEVVFTAVSSDTDGDTLGLSWDLGDGQAATGASVVHVYAREGVFPVALTASDGRGATLGGRPFSVPDKGCLGALHGRAISPRALRLEFQTCDNDTVVIEGTVSADLRRVTGTYAHPDGPPQPIVLTRN